MLVFMTAALAEPPATLDASVLPVFPERVGGDVDVECVVEMVSDAEGRHDVKGVHGCGGPFEDAVRDRLSWMTWRVPPQTAEGPVEQGYAMLTGDAGAPGGLYVRIGVRFRRTGDEEPTVEVVPKQVVRPKRSLKKLEVAPEELASVGDGCLLLVHVDPAGITERVQSQTCTEGVREAFEVPLMTWSWEPLVVSGARRAFVATFRVAPAP